jgi:hypothetical protein
MPHAVQIDDIYPRLLPYLKARRTPCTVAQLRAVAEQLGNDEYVDVYYDVEEDRLILS